VRVPADTMHPSRRGRCRTATAVFSALMLAGCGHAPARSDSLLQLAAPTTVVLHTQQVPGVGVVLADTSGHTVYLFPPDADSRVTCTGPCAGTWPPLSITASGEVAAGAGVHADQVGRTADPNSGADVVTYAAHPLYRYAGDITPGTANGQALFLNGGPWYVLTAAGQPVTTTPTGTR